jgi:hypothetical protein
MNFAPFIINTPLYFGTQGSIYYGAQGPINYIVQESKQKLLFDEIVTFKPEKKKLWADEIGVGYQQD